MNREDKLSKFEKSFWQISRKMSYEWKKIYQEKFPGSQSHIVFLLEREGNMKMSELAEAINLTPGAITTATGHLIQNGYIERIQNEQDKRVTYLSITNKGSLALNELQNKGRKIVKIIFKDASNEQFEIMFQVFENAIINIDKLREVNNK